MYDNNPGFYKLKKDFPQLITIAIQKAWKFDVEFDLIYHRHKNKNDLGYKCDYLFCYNKFIAYIFSIYKNKEYSIGSFLSNSEKLRPEKKDYIIYISQWKNMGNHKYFTKT